MSLQCVYKRQLIVCVAEDTQQVFITAQGQGEEPQLEFCPSLLELGPCLPFSMEVEATVTVKNPGSFPVEFYSLEFDTQYLEEEKVALSLKFQKRMCFTMECTVMKSEKQGYMMTLNSS